jgi:transcriptional regulator of aromatic amino acid metabolism
MDSIEFPCPNDVQLVRRLTSTGRRPNLLVQCRGVNEESVLVSLMTSCQPPYSFCYPPKALQLPEKRRGTLFLVNAAAMTLEQQIELYDWMQGGTEDIQIVSLVTGSLYDRVLEGEFLEGLYYRLNVLCLDANHSRH